MSQPVTLESLAKRVEALEGKAAAQLPPADPAAPIVFKDWRLAVGVITDLEGYAQIAAAGAAIRQAEPDDADASLTDPPQSADLERGEAGALEGFTMSQPTTLESLAQRLDAVEARLTAAQSAVPPWLAFVNSLDRTPSAESQAAWEQFHEEIRKARVAERLELGPDVPPAERHEGAA